MLPVLGSFKDWFLLSGVAGRFLSSLIHNSLFLSLFSFSLLFTFLDCSPPLFSRLPRYSTSHYVGPLDCWSVSSPRRAVCQFHFTFSAFMHYFSSPLLPKFPSDLFNPCNPSLEAQNPAPRLRSQPKGSNPILLTQIPATKPNSQT